MVSIKNIMIGGLVVLIGIAGALYFFQSEGKKTEKQFTQLSKWASKDLDENNFTAARKTKSIGTLFAENCSIKAHINSVSGTYTPEEIAGLAAHARSRFSELAVGFHDLHIGFPQKEIAKVNVTAWLSGTLKGGGLAEDTLELECRLKKLEDKWLFFTFEVVEVLEK